MNQLVVGQVDVWLTALEALTADLLYSYEAILSTDERERLRRFIVLEPRVQHVVARALLRTTLSRYAEVEPTQWCFETNKYGRPYLAAPVIGHDLRFNLSHTTHLVALAITEGCEIGIDVEYTLRQFDSDRLASTVFAPAEIKALQAAPQSQRRELFWAFWTLKEAYIKARGMGLSLPLDGFAFDLSFTHPRIDFNERCPDDPSSWQFRRCAPTPDHTLAVAVTAPEAAVDIRLMWTVPEVRRKVD